MESPATKTRKKPTKIEEMSKEQIRQAILKKRESTAKAQGIVENLLEKNVFETYFLECLPDINQSHFEDIIEERSIIHLCGYPLCDKPISVKDIPKQKYRISVKTNKVYDITGRKSFCSNHCYNAAMHVKKQMLTSPLWFREYEDIPKFNLLPRGSEGSMGQEIDVSIIPKVKIVEQPAFTSINDFAGASLNEFDDDPDTLKNPTESDSTNTEKLNSTENTNNEIHKLMSDLTINPSQENPKASIEKPKPAPNPFNIVGEIVERPERKIDPILTNKPPELETQGTRSKKVQQKKQPLLSALTIEVEKSLAEWFTIDTTMFLLGEEKVRELVTDKGECIKEYMDNYAQSIFYNSNTYDQYQALCRKLNILELEDRKIDAKAKQRELKPLPDYSILQEESKRMQLKIKAYFEGSTEIPEPTSNEPSAVSDDANLTQLPLVDKNAQNALRRKIVSQHLNKVLPDLLRSLGLVTFSVSNELKLLINTFKLSANNIMFKPLQWTLIAIIILKLLSLRDKKLEQSLEQPTAFQHMQLLLLSYQLDGGYVDRLMSWLLDIDRLLDSNDKQMTLK